MDFIAGSWADPEAPDGAIEDRSPADLSLLLGRHPWAVSQADAAVAAAREAQPAFGARPAGDREQLVRRIGAVLKDHEEELARAIALDVGKRSWELPTKRQPSTAKPALTAAEAMNRASPFPCPG